MWMVTVSRTSTKKHSVLSGSTWFLNFNHFICFLSADLTITTAFPCRSRLDDPTNGPLVEKEIRKEIELRGLIPVGWYHSHPVLPASPSLRDIDKQLDHEMHMKGSSDSSYTPCIGVICCKCCKRKVNDSKPNVNFSWWCYFSHVLAPYFTDTSNVESSIVGYWVAPPPENKPLEYGKPMLMNYTVAQDAVLHPDVVKELVIMYAAMSFKSNVWHCEVPLHLSSYFMNFSHPW